MEEKLLRDLSTTTSGSKGRGREHSVKSQAPSGATYAAKTQQETRKSRLRLAIRASTATTSASSIYSPARAPLQRGSLFEGGPTT
jgi:hypothetical protein